MCQAEDHVLLDTPRGSRRRRLWELGAHAHCPIIGVCLPIANLRSLIDKVLAGHALARDYELHCGAIAECKRRTQIAEAIQRELDRRYALALRQSSKMKTADALETWWRSASAIDLPGALWATLSHPRCEPALEEGVLGDVHMLQHQIGVARRVDVQLFDELRREHTAMTRELGELQRRHRSLGDESARRHELDQAEVLRLRAQLIARDTTIGKLQEQIDATDAAPRLVREAQREAQRDAHRDSRRIDALERALLDARAEADKQRTRADAAESAIAAVPPAAQAALESAPSSWATTGEVDAVSFAHRNVLCVGGRPASIPIYRDLVERTGGKFLHHDGGEEESVTKLDATLAAADLVICQAGCVSHGAYWRVKDHCKRTGKRCVFVDSPSAAGIKRALAELREVES